MLPQSFSDLTRDYRTGTRASSSDASRFCLAPGGVYHAGYVTIPPVRSYRTLSPLPAKAGGLLSVALSFESPRLAVNQHHALWSSDFPPAVTRRRSPVLVGESLKSILARFCLVDRKTFAEYHQSRALLACFKCVHAQNFIKLLRRYAHSAARTNFVLHINNRDTASLLHDSIEATQGRSIDQPMNLLFPLSLFDTLRESSLYV